MSLNNHKPVVCSINISKGGIPKLPIDSVRIRFAGLEGDGHNHAKHYRPIQAVCLQDLESLEQFTKEGYPLEPGTAGENLTVTNLNVNKLPLGTILTFENGVVIRLSKVRKPCYVMDEINPRLKDDAWGRHGMYAEVLQEGVLTKGEAIEITVPAVVEQ